MTRSHALVLTGEVLPGFEPASVWPQLAAYFRVAPDRMAQALACTAHDGQSAGLTCVRDTRTIIPCC